MSPDEPSVVLRALLVQDADELARWSRDEDLRRAAGWSDRPEDEHRAHHLSLVAAPPTDLIRLAATHDGHLVGHVDLYGRSPHRRELGFLVGPRQRWGRGLGLAAARAGLHHGFTVLGLTEIWAEAFDTNHASIRILRRLGMTETGEGGTGEHLGLPARYRQFVITAGE